MYIATTGDSCFVSENGKGGWKAIKRSDFELAFNTLSRADLLGAIRTFFADQAVVRDELPNSVVYQMPLSGTLPIMAAAPTVKEDKPFTELPSLFS